MSNLIIVVGSASSASRLAKKLNRYGKRAAVISTPPEIRSGSSCSSSVKTELSSEYIIKNNIKGITVTGVYIEEAIGEKRFYHDLLG